MKQCQKRPNRYLCGDGLRVAMAAPSLDLGMSQWTGCCLSRPDLCNVPGEVGAWGLCNLQFLATTSSREARGSLEARISWTVGLNTDTSRGSLRGVNDGHDEKTFTLPAACDNLEVPVL
ncbi:hypothetical protein CLAIMM_10170 isoform 1 [Cladophialophora immunda]|nr:hypothetical protein CLAIMM_10170 isoform 1 [Cladophialophora immunda]